jgi:hypothetical protein
LPGCIAGGVVEAQKGEFVGLVAVDVVQLRHAGCRFCVLADDAHILVHPLDEIPRPSCVIKNEDRRALHSVGHNRTFHSATQVEQLHPPVVRGDERAFGRRQGNDKVPLCVLAVDGQRPGKAQGNLHDACEILHIARGSVGVKGVVGDVFHFGVGKVRHKALAGRDNLRAVVIIAVTRDGGQFAGLGDGVVHAEFDTAKGFGLDRQLDFVLAFGQAITADLNVHNLAQGKIDGVGFADGGRFHLLPVANVQGNGAEGDSFAVEAHLLKFGDLGVAQPVFDVETHPAVHIFQATKGVQPFQKHTGNQRHRFFLSFVENQ